MPRSTFNLVIAAVCFLVLAGVAIAVSTGERPGPMVATDDATRVEAPGTRVETDADKTRVQAPGVDITVPKNKDEN
jgi:hypothetical protein